MNLSLFLNKYHVIKKWTGGIAPRILTLGTILGHVIYLQTPIGLYACAHWVGDWVASSIDWTL
jgi:hypothetical protein